MTVRRVPVRSSVIAAVGYDDQTAELEVQFRSGEVYRYFAVPPSVHRALMDAESPGGYFNRHISGHYPTRQQY